MKGEESKSDKLIKKRKRKKQVMTTSSYMPLRTSVQLVYSLLPRAFLLCPLVILPTKCFVSQDFISKYLLDASNLNSKTAILSITTMFHYIE